MVATHAPDKFKFSSNSFKPEVSSCALSLDDADTVLMVESVIESGMTVSRDWEELK